MCNALALGIYSKEYMKREPDKNKKSEEVQDIIDRMPTRWATWVAMVVTILMGIVVCLSFVIKYPDTVTGQVVVTSAGAPVRLVANSRGRIHLLRSDGCIVKKGEPIAYIDNGVTLDEVATVENVIGKTFKPDTELRLVEGLSLGELTSSYSSLVTAYRQYDLLRRSGLYDNMRQSVRQQMQTDAALAQNIDQDIVLKDRQTATKLLRHGKDSVLLAHHAISEEEYENRLAALLTIQESALSLRSSRMAKQADIDKNRTQLSRLAIEEYEAMQKAFAEVAAQWKRLRGDIRQWREQCVLTASVDGMLEHLGFWRDNMFVQQNEELFSVIPRQKHYTVEAYLPTSGMGKVRKGQKVNIKLNDFPYNEYGFIEGTVAHISQVVNRMSGSGGTLDTYRIRICLPKGVVTNHGQRLCLKRETKGTADIITAPKRLVERLFDNLDAKKNK